MTDPRKRYELVLGPNTNQWWVYDNDCDCFIDPPVEVLNRIDEKESYEEQEALFAEIVYANPNWLNDTPYRYSGEDIEP